MLAFFNILYGSRADYSKRDSWLVVQWLPCQLFSFFCSLWPLVLAAKSHCTLYSSLAIVIAEAARCYCLSSIYLVFHLTHPNKSTKSLNEMYKYSLSTLLLGLRSFLGAWEFSYEGWWVSQVKHSEMRVGGSKAFWTFFQEIHVDKYWCP